MRVGVAVHIGNLVLSAHLVSFFTESIVQNLVSIGLVVFGLWRVKKGFPLNLSDRYNVAKHQRAVM